MHSLVVEVRKPVIETLSELKGKTFTEIKALGLYPKFEELVKFYIIDLKHDVAYTARKIGVSDYVIRYYLRLKGIRPVIIRGAVPATGELSDVEKPEDAVYIGGIRYKRVYIVPDKNLAYFAGYLYGDGGVIRTLKKVDKEYKVTHVYCYLASTDFRDEIMLKEVIEKIAKKYGGTMWETYRKVDGKVTRVREEAYSYIIYLGNPAIARIFTSVERIKRLEPIEFFMKNKELMGPFLAGICDADGFIYTGKMPMIGLEQAEVNKDILHMIAKYLPLHKISYSIGVTKPTRRMHITPLGYVAKRPIMHRIAVITKESMRRWVEVVGEYILTYKRKEQLQHLLRWMREREILKHSPITYEK